MTEISKEFDIYNSKERKVICISNTEKYGTYDDHKLLVGNTYTVDWVCVCGWHTEVGLKEIDGTFNSCSFCEV